MGLSSAALAADSDSAIQSRRPISRIALILVPLGALVAALALAISPARAVFTHPFEFSFDGSDTPQGDLGTAATSADKLAVRQSNGDVYVWNKDDAVVNVFDGSGSFKSQLTGFTSVGSDPDLAVDNSPTASEGNLYVKPEFNDLEAYDSSGNLLFTLDGSEITDTSDNAFGDGCGVAVHPTNGDLYVSSWSNSAIYRYDSAGNFIETVTTTLPFQPCDIAVDTDGSIYAVHWNNSLRKLSPSGVDQGIIDPNNPSAVNIDTTNGHVYSNRRGSIAEYDASGNLQFVFGSAELTNSRGVDTNVSTGRVYATSNPSGPHVVAVFGPGVLVPGVTTGDATNITPTSATLNGTINPDGVEAFYQFEWGTDTTYGNVVPAAPVSVGDGTSDVAVMESLTGLAPDTTYHFRLVGSNANGTNNGQDQTFTTPPSPAVTTGEATDVTPTTARLNGTINPDNLATTYHFEYGLTPCNDPGDCPNTTPDGNLPAGADDVPVFADITGLTQNTQYHFRLVGTNANGTTFGDSETFTTPPSPVVTTDPATNVTPNGARLNGTINPTGLETTYHFEWGTTTAYGNIIPIPDASAGSGTSDVQVFEDLTGLTSGETYHFRLVGTNANGTNNGQDRTFTTPLDHPTVIDASVTNIGTTSALIKADIRAAEFGTPDGTTFRVEYGTDTSYGQSTPDASIAFDNLGQVKTVSAPLDDLEPATTYHFKVVTENALGGDESADMAFGTYPLSPAPGLPDNRAYEQVSPQDKNGGDVGSLGLAGVPPNADVAAAESGNAVSWDSLTAIGDDATGGGLINSYVSTRGSSGWSTQSVSPPIPPNPLLGTAIALAYSPELEQSLAASGSAGAGPIWHRDSAGNFHNVTPGIDSNTQTPLLGGASRDFSHVVFETNQTLVSDPEAPSAGTKVYEFSDGQLHLASVLPNGDPAAGATQARPHVVSNDGSRIFWSTSGEIYMREDLSSTDHVSASQATVPDTTQAKTYWTATPDGASVFFTSPEDLTDDAATGFGSDLYRYDVDAGTLTDLTVDPSGTFGGLVVGVLGASDNGNRVYFASLGELAPGATLGQNNLYVRDGNETKFIATLATADSGNWGFGFQDTSRVTPDGQALLFTSVVPLTGYDNAGHDMAFRYDLQTDGLECVSCNTSGNEATGDVVLNPGSVLAPNPVGELRNLSDDGSRAFFTSPDPLVNADNNDTMDAYEWKQNGSLHLISAGRSGSDDSWFANASPSGDDLFIVTRDRLVFSDQDDAVDMYDARVGGGFPEPPEPCQGEECKPAPSTPAGPQIGSSNLVGPGNVEAAEDCSKLERKAKKAKRKLKRTKRKLRRARRADQDNKVDRLKKQKKRKAKRAKRANRKLKQCRRQQREDK